jgi:hypothetical protein
MNQSSSRRPDQLPDDSSVWLTSYRPLHNNSTIMRSLVGLTLSFALLLPVASAAQQTGNVQPSSAAPVAASAVERIAIEGVLRRYESAYSRQNIDELVAVWPSLQNDKKNFKKMKDELGRADISDRKVAMEVQDVQNVPGGDFLVRCSRSDQYMKLQTTSYSSGDLQIQSMPSQHPGPSQQADKVPVHKTSDVWLTMHHTGSDWTIASVSDKKPH